MGDRNLSTTEEEAGYSDISYTMKIDRSAAGQPGMFFTIINGLEEESTFVAKDAWAVLAAPLAWLITDEFTAEVSEQLLQDSILGTGYDSVHPELQAIVSQQVEGVLKALIAVAQKRVS